MSRPVSGVLLDLWVSLGPCPSESPGSGPTHKWTNNCSGTAQAPWRKSMQDIVLSINGLELVLGPSLIHQKADTSPRIHLAPAMPTRSLIPAVAPPGIQSVMPVLQEFTMELGDHCGWIFRHFPVLLRTWNFLTVSDSKTPAAILKITSASTYQLQIYGLKFSTYNHAAISGPSKSLLTYPWIFPALIIMLDGIYFAVFAFISLPIL